MNQRLRALCDLSMGSAREYVGRHEYDGRVEDLSPEGVRGRPGPRRRATPPEPDPHDEAHLAAFEAAGAAGAGRAGAAPLQPAVPHRQPRRGLLRPRLRPRGRAGRGPPPPPGRLARRGGRRRDRPRPGGRPGGRGPAARRPRPGRRPGGRRRDPVRRARPSRPTTGWSPTWRRPPTAATATPPSAAGRWTRLLGRGRGARGRPGPAGRAGRRRARPAPGHAGGGLRAAGAGPAHRRGGGRAAGDHPDAGGVLREAEALTDEVDRLHPRARPGARAGRRVPGRARAPVAPLGAWP